MNLINNIVLDQNNKKYPIFASTITIKAINNVAEKIEIPLIVGGGIVDLHGIKNAFSPI